MLEDARLVVIAGVADPGTCVPLLREYVQQGGQLLIAAGGRFDRRANSGFVPSLWTSNAWLEGAGVLPLPLLPDVLGTPPEQAGQNLQPFFLSFDSLASHSYFQLAGVGEDELRALYSEPFFFQAVQVDNSSDTLQALHQTQLQRLDDELSLMQQLAVGTRNGSADQSSSRDPTQLIQDEQRLSQLRPSWLMWGDATSELDSIEVPDDPQQRERQLSNLAAHTHPRVLARFDDENGTPFLVERKIGNGTVLFASSGLTSQWNTLATTNAMLMFDRILRGMIRATLPTRNFATVDRITLPLPTPDRDVRTLLQRPGQSSTAQTLDVGFVGRERLGVSIEQPQARGIYRLTAQRTETNGGGSAAPQTVWALPLAVNGEAAESDLQMLTREQFEQRVLLDNVQWVGQGEAISLAGSQVQGQDSWWWLTLTVLGLLLLELAILASSVGTSGNVQTVAAT
jgi:hypothetical protein